MTAPSHARKCQREVSLLVDSTTKQPGVSDIVEWFLTMATTANNAMRMLKEQPKPEPEPEPEPEP